MANSLATDLAINSGFSIFTQTVILQFWPPRSLQSTTLPFATTIRSPIPQLTRVTSPLGSWQYPVTVPSMLRHLLKTYLPRVSLVGAKQCLSVIVLPL